MRDTFAYCGQLFFYMAFACCVNVYMYNGECAREQHVRRTLILTLTHTITAYSVSGNVVRVRILICATIQNPCRKGVYLL